jgi:hypothetical protein
LNLLMDRGEALVYEHTLSLGGRLYYWWPKVSVTNQLRRHQEQVLVPWQLVLASLNLSCRGPCNLRGKNCNHLISFISFGNSHSYYKITEISYF